MFLNILELFQKLGGGQKKVIHLKMGEIYKSIQQINPMLDPLEITFYFKY
jgi:hypothetical protein